MKYLCIELIYIFTITRSKRVWFLLREREREREHDVITADNFFNKERKNERINVRESKK